MGDIIPFHRKAIELAKSYIGTTAEPDKLGFGVSGVVFLSPGGTTAIKIHQRLRSFQVELQAYEIITKHGLFDICGLSIPRLLHYDTKMRIIEMTVVEPPYLLDFAGVTFEPIDFSTDTQREIGLKIERQFGTNAHFAYLVQHELEKYGIYYLE